ncbi:MAG: nucleoside triphosphate pyrophosphohydrolase [Anaerovoracaceae bacterium]|nr:nucleoside triphosphate pyrophosphohydrolase [Anaerovoracaceae bacterium]
MNEKYSEYYEDAKTPEEALGRLAGIIEILRRECPWDRVQTHESLETCMIEEAYEAVDAIRSRDTENLREELGDVTMQVIFHSSLCAEEGEFDLTDVFNEECRKMIRRHPHIFGDSNAETVDKVLERWENIKCIEHGHASVTEEMERVPHAFPALIRSAKVQKKAGTVGFDFDSAGHACEKLQEETLELIEACRSEDKTKITEEIGDVLFSVVNVARLLDVDAEGALREAVEKFIDRFAFIEREAGHAGKTVAQMDIDEMNRLWDASKGE